MASAAMASSATAQHNLLALQTQLLSLQSENATLTKALSLKENYVLQKEQQLRVLQQRLDELEGGVAAWKDRYLQQLHANANGTSASDANGSALSTGEWTALPLPAPSGAQELPNADAMGSLVEKLSTADREKLKALIGMERSRSPGQARAPWDEGFVDVSDELQSVLLQYLMPILLETQRIENQRATADGTTMAVHCLTRRYTKQATDFKIVCQLLPTSSADADANADQATKAATPARAVVATPDAASSAPHRGSYGTPSGAASTAGATSSAGASTGATASRSSLSLAAAAAAAAERQPVADEHLFDCVECDAAKRGFAPVPHGPREIHPSKAVYISRPLAPPSPLSKRFSLAPGKTSGGAGSSDGSRTMTMGTGSITGYPSGSSARSDSSFRDSMDGDRRSGASSSSLTGSAPSGKDSGKIKKIMGSVMKGLNRHKPPPTVANPQLEEEEDDSVCDGCGRGPLTGAKWVCRTCKLHKDQAYALCEKCYGQGIHGKENEDALFERIEEIVVSKCPKLGREQDLMKLLRVGICKANLKKYSFCLTWIADLLLCKATKDLRARALEISQISPQVRSEFVRLLTELLTKHRRDIELITEWQPVQNVAPSSGAGANDGTGSGMLQLDTLRIWVKDAVVDAAAAGT